MYPLRNAVFIERAKSAVEHAGATLCGVVMVNCITAAKAYGQGAFAGFELGRIPLRRDRASGKGAASLMRMPRAALLHVSHRCGSGAGYYALQEKLVTDHTVNWMTRMVQTTGESASS